MLRVVHFQRKRRKNNNYSVEGYFSQIRRLLPRKEIQAIPFISKYESKGFWKRLYNIFEAANNQGDVNHVTGDVHFLTLLLKKSKTILTILDCGMLHGKSGIKFQLLKYFWFTLPVKKVAYITVISEATKKDLLNYIQFPEEKIKVIYVSIGDHFKPAPQPFNKEKPILLQIGTAPNKNLARLIPAISGINCTLYIVGKLNDEILGLLAEHTIDYQNFLNLNDQEIYELYRQSDIVTFVSTLEGFGMPIVEANAVGRVVITGNSSSMPEIGGDAALMVNPFDTKEIREGILKLISNDDFRNQIIQRGFNNVKRFSGDEIGKQYAQLYENCNSNKISVSFVH